MSEKKKSFLSGATVLAVAGLICKVIGAVYKIPLRSFVGDETMGIYTTVYPIYTFLLIFSTSGIPTAISKLVAGERNKGNYYGAHQVFVSSLRLLLLIGGVTTALMAIGSPWIAELLRLSSPQPVLAISFSLLFVSLLSAFRGYYQGMQNMVPTAVTQLVEQLVKLAAGFFFAIRWFNRYGPDAGAAGALLGITISELVAFLVILFLYRRDKNKIMREVESDAEKRSERCMRLLLAIAIPMTIGGAIKPLVDSVDSVMVRNILERSLGFSIPYINKVYGFLKNDAGTLVNLPSVLTVALSMALVPAVSENAQNKSEMHKITRTGLKLSVVVGLPCCIGLFVLAKQILSLLYVYVDEAGFAADEKLAMAATFMRILSVGVFLLAVIQTTSGILQGLGHVTVPVVNLAIGMLVKIIINLTLVPQGNVHIYGVPIGTVTCYAIAAVLDVIAVLRYTRVRPRLFDTLVRPLCASGLMLAVLWASEFAFGDDMIGGGKAKVLTFAFILLAAIVYFVGLLIFSVFDEEDVAFMPGGGKIKKLLEKIGVDVRRAE